MAAALEDIRARIDRGLGRADVPTLDGLKARIAAAKGSPPVPRRRPDDIAEQEPFEPRPGAPRRDYPSSGWEAVASYP